MDISKCQCSFGFDVGRKFNVASVYVMRDVQVDREGCS